MRVERPKVIAVCDVSGSVAQVARFLLLHRGRRSLSLDVKSEAGRAIVERLTRGPASVSELAQPLDMKLPSVLQHLGVLEASGLVHSAKSGRVRTCHIQPAVMQSAEKWITGRRATWERHLDQLGAALSEQVPPTVPRRK